MKYVRDVEQLHIQEKEEKRRSKITENISEKENQHHVGASSTEWSKMCALDRKCF